MKAWNLSSSANWHLLMTNSLTSLGNNRRYIYWFLLRFLAQSCSNPYNFPSDKSTQSIFCSNVLSLTLVPKSLGISCVTGVHFVRMRQLLVSSWVTPEWSWSPERPSSDEKLGTFKLMQKHPPILRRGEGLGIEVMIDHICVMKPP